MIRFTLTSRSGYEIRIVIYARRSDMWRALAVAGYEDAKSVGACCEDIKSYTFKKKGRSKIKRYTQISFCEDLLGSGIVAHELQHALYRIPEILRMLRAGGDWLRRRKWGQSTEAEVVCQVIGQLTVDFWREYYRQKKKQRKRVKKK